MPEKATSLIYDDTDEGMMAWTGGNGTSKFCELAKRCRDVGSQEERVLGKAGACTLFANALDRTLSGQCCLPFLVVCVGLHGLIRTSKKNRGVFVGSKGIHSLTRMLAGATQRGAWHLVEAINGCILSLCTNRSSCDACASAGTFQAVSQSIIAGVQGAKGMDASGAACQALFFLHDQAVHCQNTQCMHTDHMAGIDPALLPALGECLFHAVNAGDVVSITAICRMIGEALQSDCVGDKAASALATPRVGQTLTAACHMAVSPEYLTQGLRTDDRWALGAAVCLAVGQVCRRNKLTSSAGLRRACPLVARIIQRANEDQQGFSLVQLEACKALTQLAKDTACRECLVDEGTVEAVLDAMGGSLERGAWNIHQSAATTLRNLVTSNEAGLKRLAARPKPATCKLLVDSLKFVLAHGDGCDDGSYTHGVSCLIHYWLELCEEHPACRKHLLAAGAKEVIARAVAMAEAEGDTNSAKWFRGLKASVLRKIFS
eukprot:jgi/Mesvir1/8861/Mv02757-RA.2